MAKTKPHTSNDGATLVVYSDSGRIISRRKLKMWSAHKDSPSVIDIAVSGPDDRGVYQDIFIDIKKLKDLLFANNLI